MKCTIDLVPDLDMEMEHLKLSLFQKGIITSKSKAESVAWLIEQVVIGGRSWAEIKESLK